MKSLQFNKGRVIKLPQPMLEGGMPLVEAIERRESIRDLIAEPLTLAEVSQILWSAQGITRSMRGRTAPSAGALYPLEIYLAQCNGLFHYVPEDHQLTQITDRNLLKDIAHAALGQGVIQRAAVVVIITAVYERIERKYGSRGRRYVFMEAGHTAQNVLLQVVSLGLGAVPVGAFYDDRMKEMLDLPEDHDPVYLIPVGHVR